MRRDRAGSSAFECGSLRSLTASASSSGYFLSGLGYTKSLSGRARFFGRCLQRGGGRARDQLGTLMWGRKGTETGSRARGEIAVCRAAWCPSRALTIAGRALSGVSAVFARRGCARRAVAYPKPTPDRSLHRPAWLTDPRWPAMSSRGALTTQEQLASRGHGAVGRVASRGNRPRGLRASSPAPPNHPVSDQVSAGEAK